MSDWVETARILCECNCGIEAQLHDRRLDRIRGDKAHPGSQGYTCNKAMRLDRYQTGPHRLTSPMRRTPDGSYEEVDWDSAIAEIAAGFKRIAGEHGGESIFDYGGGGQGNHLGGSYSGAFLRALGSRYRSSALAQEKTGEGWVEHSLYGSHTRGEFEHAEVAVFVGKNPWMSQSFPRARVVLREISKDPERSMIVIDPVVTDTAKLADFHLRVRPGTDAWCLAAMGGVLVQEDLVDHEFLVAHATGVPAVLEHLGQVDVSRYASYCGVDEGLIRAAVRRIADAASVSVFEDLGIQQGPNSTLCSYVNRMLWILTGNFGNPGGMHLHTSFVNLFRDRTVRHTPVTGARILAGLVPCNVIPDEILTDHPKRFRAMIVESANPAHPLADSQRFREAFEALDLLLVIDVAMTETARQADYVLPAASQYEKPEATFFNFEFPDNTFHLRRPLLEPLMSHCPRRQIWARLVRALGLVDEAELAPLREAAAESRQAYTEAFATATTQNATLSKPPPYVLVRDARPAAAPVPPEHQVKPMVPRPSACAPGPPARRPRRRQWPSDEGSSTTAPGQLPMPGRPGTTSSASSTTPSVSRSSPPRCWRARRARRRPVSRTNERLPIVLSVGERRSFTANDIFRHPGRRKRDPDGALRVSAADASRIGLVDGGRARVTTARGSAEATVEVSDAKLAGHASLPNGLGLDYTDENGETVVPGVAPNSLTSSEWRDDFAGTPWHKHVPARIEPVGTRPRPGLSATAAWPC